MQDHYLNRLRPAQLTLTWSECTTWVNSQDIPRQLFLANYLWLQQTKASATAYPYEPTDENLLAPPAAAVATVENPDMIAIDLSGSALPISQQVSEVVPV
jgi:hypothetical protein